MKQEYKELLLKDLCARLPYGIKADFKQGHLTRVKHEVEGWYIDKIKDDKFEFIRLYLRPMSSMTNLEQEELKRIAKTPNDWNRVVKMQDFFCSHHLDYRGLFVMGLALEAPENMYKTE